MNDRLPTYQDDEDDFMAKVVIVGFAALVAALVGAVVLLDLFVHVIVRIT